MRTVFRFSDKSSFEGDESRKLAEIIIDSPLAIRRQIKADLGISLELDSDPIRVSHDGRKIGLGSFGYSKGEVTISVGPKVDALRIKKLFKALGEDKRGGNAVRFEKVSSRGEVEKIESDFTPAFLLSLLDDIAVLSAQLFSSANRKKVIRVTAGIRGRPLLSKSLVDFHLGRGLGILCEVMNEESLFEYKLVILATASDITLVLKEWENLLSMAHEEPDLKWRYLSAKFRMWDTSQFSLSLLYKLCRPPFPYGLREILYKCLRYWKWRANFQLTAEGLAVSNFRGMFINLDSLFEKYVGQVFERSLSQYQRVPAAGSFTISGLGAGPGNRSVDPDHLFVGTNDRVLLIVDAKYRVDVATRDQVFQMVSYLDYEYADFDSAYRKVGVLVYPGDEWRSGRVNDFGKDLLLLQIPAESESLQPKLTELISAQI